MFSKNVTPRGDITYIVDLNFESLKDASVIDYVDAVGVYILWNPSSTVRPTYIGQGIILDRISAHAKVWLNNNFCGIVARTDKERTRKTALSDSKLAEAFLLYLAYQKDYFPSRNKAPGNIRQFFDESDWHGVLKFNVRGYHPFKKPDSSRCRLDHTVPLSITFDKNNLDNSTLSCPWPRRQ